MFGVWLNLSVDPKEIYGKDFFVLVDGFLKN